MGPAAGSCERALRAWFREWPGPALLLGDGRRELVLRDSLQVTFDWEEYGGEGMSHLWRFTEGEVMFASPLGSSHSP
jgi:hypothetical protein